MSIYTEMYKGGKHKMLIKTSQINHYLANGFSMKPEQEEPKKQTYTPKAKEDAASGDK